MLICYLAVVLLVALVVGQATGSRARAKSIDRIQGQMREIALQLHEDFAASFQANSQINIQRLANQVELEPGFRVTLITDDGNVLADSQVDSTDTLTVGLGSEISMAHTHGEGWSERFGKLSKQRMAIFAERIGPADSPEGFIRIAVPLSRIDSDVAEIKNVVWGTSAALAFGIVIVTWLITRRVYRFVHAAADAARVLESSETSQLIDTEERGELGELAAALNSMSQHLSTRIQNLERQGHELKENSNLLETVLGSMIEGVVVIDRDERVLYANQAACTMLELAKSDPVGRPILEVARQPQIQTVVQRALTEGSQQQAEFSLPRTQLVVALQAISLPDASSAGVVIVLHDVTDLRRLENMRREFVSNVSHELKTPLTSIQAYTETLLNGAIEDPEHNRQFLQRIEEQGDRLNALILDLLKLARIESEESVFDVVPVRAQSAIEECISEHAEVARTKGVDLQAEPFDDSLFVMADAEGLRMILDNLIDNAINYTPRGGRVTVSCSSDSQMASIVVADTGIGIPPEQQVRIFERFYRVDKARSREIGGTGLGLSIVKHLCNVFGGSIEVQSDPGKGSIFTVRLRRESSVNAIKEVT